MPEIIQTLILAAGEAKRMGRLKQLLPYNKQTLLGSAIALASDLPTAKPLVVLGCEAQRIKQQLETKEADFTINPNWQLGMGNSLAHGLKWALDQGGEIGAILVLLADQPKIQKAHLLKLIQTYEQEKCSIVATRYPNGGGVPAIFDKSLFPDLTQLTGDRGARDLIRSHPAAIALIPEENALWDIDTPDDYQQLLDRDY